ncbi:hypothetical protein AAEO56_15840 [Flavobacterium sp. DGU11]|uniref:Lipocalin-like domain-containing protein n=1 Tax=Flavobacterium arundinis TaxID=3139143 RepID=A0ABU9HZZ8_9FLAO
MKKIIVGLMVLALLSCNDNDAVMRRFNGAESGFTKGQWHITAFTKDGRQATTNYAAFTFSFTEEGRIIATDGKHRYNGSWLVQCEDSSDDGPTADPDFIISFKQPGTLTTLNGEWIVIKKEPAYLSLSRLTSNNNSSDSLVFRKL